MSVSAEYTYVGGWNVRVRKLEDGRLVAIFHAKELISFIRSYLEIGMGPIAVKMILNIEGVAEHVVSLEERELMRWEESTSTQKGKQNE
jgi:hypothetical protein